MGKLLRGRSLVKERYWREKIEEWRVSGLSQAEFCRRNEFKENNLSFWKRVIKERDAERQKKKSRLVGDPGRDGGQPAFVPIELKKPVGESAGEAFIELRTPAGYTFKVPGAVAQELCQFVLKMLVDKKC